MNDGLKDKHRQAIIDILAAHRGVERVVLFGSRAMGTFTATSDVDIVLFGDSLSLDDQTRLAREIDRLPMPQRVDLLRYRTIKDKKLLAHIRKRGVEWFSRTRPQKTLSGDVERCFSMANDGFPTEKLGSLCSKVGSGATPRGGSKVYLDKGKIALIRSQNVYNDGFNREGLVYITAEHAEQLSNVTVEPEDVLLNITGDSVARCCQVDPRVLPARVNQHVSIIRPKPDELIPRFLRYFLVSPTMQAQMLSWAHAGATRKALTKGMIESFKVPKPELTIQQRIAHILGTLDDKIELNRRMNQTLEKMAAAIFKSWFIDFDPVHAKADGQYTGLPEEISDLFPDSFEDSEMGPIPKGWDIKPIGDVVQCVGGATPSTKNPEFWAFGTHPFVTPKDMSSLQSHVIFDSERHITDSGVEKISSKQLPVGTLLLSSRAPIGYLAIALVPVSVNQGIIAMICEGCLTNLYVLHWINTNMDIIKSRAGGTTFAEISKRNFRPIPMLIPQPDVLKAFMNGVEFWYDQIALNVRQSSHLAHLRNTLLPNLLSGDIVLPAAEAIAEVARNDDR